MEKDGEKGREKYNKQLLYYEIIYENFSLKRKRYG